MKILVQGKEYIVKIKKTEFGAFVNVDTNILTISDKYNEWSSNELKSVIRHELTHLFMFQNNFQDVNIKTIGLDARQIDEMIACIFERHYKEFNLLMTKTTNEIHKYLMEQSNEKSKDRK